MTFMTNNDFTQPLLAWYDQNGRKNLPWQYPVDVYRIWVSEIMLQQTQVKTVIPYFERFIHRFPTLETLAATSLDEVLNYWAGLGYYSRGRNLHKAAQIIKNKFQGQCPKTYEDWLSLPGVGESTAAAICSQAFNQQTPILDGNVKRVLCRYFFIDQPINLAATQKKLWSLAHQCMSQHASRRYTQAIMDLGALCCTRHKPQCTQCPLAKTCLAFQKKIHELPVPKPKIIRPIHQQHFLLITHQKQIYLEKRPNVGIWGGLWCLPSIEFSDCLATYMRSTYQLEINNIQELITFKHSFTHYHLHIKAITLETTPPTISVDKGKYFTRDELPFLGLAKPISKILECFYKK